MNVSFLHMYNRTSFYTRGKIVPRFRNVSRTVNLRMARDQCYDHNFLRFLTVFGEKIGVFLKKQILRSQFLQKLAVV
jgi:hypothetical protein